MKRLLLIFSLIFTSYSIGFAQQQYTVNGQTYSLKTEVDGTISLLWNTIDGDYRYFVKKGATIEELKNSRTNGSYQEEYKDVLRLLTADSPAEVEKVKLTTTSLADFINAYNKRMDPNFDAGGEKIELELRLGPFLGVSNAVFTDNPMNKMLVTAGADLELVDQVKLKRHSVVLRFKQTFQTSEFTYNASQLSLNYRFKFVTAPNFDIYANGKFVAYTYSELDFVVVTPDPNGGDPMEKVVRNSGGDLSAPATFGLGADVKLGKGMLFVTYNDIFGLGVDSNGEFPVDVSVGYKFGL